MSLPKPVIKLTSKFNIFLILIISLAALPEAGQKDSSKIPDKIMASFRSQYPDIPIKNYKTRQGQYLISFICNHKKSIAFYTDQGTWLKTVTKFAHVRDLPGIIQDSLK